MVKHIVTFKFNGTPAQRHAVAEAFRDALLTLPSKIDVLEDIEVGINDNEAEEWDLVLTALLPDMESVGIYAKHPDHVAAASIMAPSLSARACVDYYC